MDVKAPRGMQDILPGETARWQYVEGVLRDLARRYGYREIRTPVVEHTEVFQRGVGAGTDIVEKEMYTFLDRGGRSLSLRAEGTAPVVRAFLEHNLGAGGLPVRVYYICPIFRYDRPQAGRYRQHTQFGAEIIGSPEPAADAEVLSLAVRGLETLGLADVELHLNSVGDPVCRPRYLEALRDYFRPHLGELCDDCRRRFEIAPLRLLDCKKEHDRRIAAGAPRMLDYLCDACRAHFDGVQAHLGAMGITYRVDPGIVRGLDYYTRTAAEVFSGKIGAQNAMFGGGRYDGLAEQLGGRPTPGVGFGMGLERVLLVLEQEGVGVPADAPPDLFIATGPSEDPARARRLAIAAHGLADRLRRAGLIADADVMGRSLSAQMRHANRVGARFALIHAAAGLILRDMGTKEEWDLGADPAEAGAVEHGDTGAMERIAGAVIARVRPRAAGKERG
jgi:histidyl-tRNA synthetase